MRTTRKHVIGFALCVAATIAAALGLGFQGSGCAAQGLEQTLYVPVYSYIYYGNKEKTIDLTATLSIRNTDATRSITITLVDYHDSNGKLVRHYLSAPIKLRPLATVHYVVAESDRSGGLGASFLVAWSSSEKVSTPVVEAVMIGALSAQGISFVCSGQVVQGPSN